MGAITKRSPRRRFTLIEVIAVLLVVAILTAVAGPRFVTMAAASRAAMARAGLNEAKASLSVAYTRAYLRNLGVNPTVNMVLSNGNFTNNATVAFGHINVRVARSGTSNITLTAVNVRGTAVAGVTDTWRLPAN
jgi:MSHA pilin protein MshA